MSIFDKLQIIVCNFQFLIPSLIFHFFKKLVAFGIGYTEPEYAAATIVKFPFAIMAAAKEIVSPIDNSA